MVILERIQRFLAAVAVDPMPDSADLTVYDESLLPEMDSAIGSPGKRGHWASGSSGNLFRCEWRFERPADLASLIALYKRHEGDAPVEAAPHKRGVGLLVSYWFEVKRPGAATPLFPGAELRSAVLVHVDARHANLSLRYDSPEMTPKLREAHDEIVAALGPKTPRHALQRIIPATKPGGREKREPIS